MRSLFAVVLLSVSVFAAVLNLGKPLTVKEPMSVQKLMAAKEQYLGKTVQVKGTVTDVCRRMGCWMELVESSTGVRVKIKVEDGVIVFPKDSVGKTAIAEGVFSKLEMTREEAVAQAQHEAEANKRKFDPATIKGPVTFYQIQGTGAVVTE
ncbi:MAG TPA: DUF4920 domain-containing protein [Bryobacteraceae bacterium]|nr:DUF4920 domain-containing protein [Bryobacteraceae bacterium]